MSRKKSNDDLAPAQAGSRRPRATTVAQQGMLIRDQLAKKLLEQQGIRLEQGQEGQVIEVEAGGGQDRKGHLASARSEAQAIASQVREEIAPGGKVQPEQIWTPICPMPVDLCRVSPFFPMSQQQLKVRPFIQDLLITKNAWGSIQYTGPKLSTFEEDVLVAVLALLDDIRTRFEVEHQGKPTYAYKGPILPILRLMGLSAGSSNYKRVKAALKLMRATAFNLVLKSGRSVICGIIAGCDLDTKGQEVTIIIDPLFHELYVGGTVTLLDVLLRSKISKPTSKALYRFVMSHKDGTWQGHFLTLAASLNLDLDQPHFKLRQQIKAAISELTSLKILADESRFTSRDVVHLVRAAEPKPTKKALPRS